jgi:hypothetical protein
MTVSFVRLRPLLLASALLLLASPLHGIAAQGEGREAMQRQRAEAMSRLSSQQRQQYFAARRQLEQRQATQRLEQLDQAERCLLQARGVSAVEICQKRSIQDRQTSRQGRMRELGELHSRFNLPGRGGPRQGERGGNRPEKTKGGGRQGA